MKKLFLFFVLVLSTNLKSFCWQGQYGCGFSVKGAEPDNKRYYFDINKPEGFDTSNYIFMMWKILKDRGYELVPASEADIVIQLNFINKEVNVEGSEEVFVGEKTIESFGQNITIPVYDNRSTGHYTEKYVTLDNIKALPKNSNENTIPIWIITMERFQSSIHEYFYGIDLIWLQEGGHYIQYDIKFKKGKSFVKRLQDNWENITDEQVLIKFDERMQYLNSRTDAADYNKQINRH